MARKLTDEQRRKKAEYDKQYRIKNRERLKAYRHKYYLDHIEQQKEYSRQYRLMIKEREKNGELKENEVKANDK